jgi:hypothetical protein
MFTQTDFAVSHKYRFGRDNRFTLVGDLNILNLFDEDNITGYFTQKSTVTLSPSSTSAYGTQFINPDGSTNYVAGINAYTSGALLNSTNAYLSALSTRIDGRYGQPNSFQGPRSVRFGFRLLF